MSPRRAGDLTIEHALLGFLVERPLHGYELHQRLNEARALGLIWHVKQPHLYALLTRLETEGLISAEVIPQDARPPRRLLHLTAAGRDAFGHWLTTPVAHGRDVRIEFLAKLFWAQQHGPDTTHELIAIQRAATQAQLAQLAAALASSSDDHPYAQLVYQFRRGQLEAILHWLDNCAATLVPTPV